MIVLLIAALVGTYAWTQTQYFVGRAGADVAIYRGVNTEFGPLKFFTVYKVTDLTVDELNSSVQGQVDEGITARDQADAENIVRNLREQKVVPQTPTNCASANPTAPTTTVTPTRSPTAARPTGTHTTAGGAAGSVATAVAPATSPATTPSPEPCPSSS